MIDVQFAAVLKNPNHLFRLSILIGIKDLCKSNADGTLESLINSHNVNPHVFLNFKKLLSSDNEFDQLVSGELYMLLLEIQLLEIPPLEGSVDYFRDMLE